jgi:glycosyltransferase involved in cell wall biosynthesis
MDWRPNVDGMLYFLDEIWPLVLEKFPDAALTIVGRRPMPILKERVKNFSSVKLTGTVDDVRPYIEKADVYIVPLRIGGGSRLKILEALSMKKPIVSTSIGAEGLKVANGENILLADSPVDFSNVIGGLFHDSTLRQHLSESGRQLVEEQYQWKVIAGKLENSWIKASKDSGQAN